SVSDCAAPLRSRLGATMLTVAKLSNAFASVRRPSAWYPSSLVRRICVMIRTIRVASLSQNHHTARIFSGGSTGRLLRFQKKMVGAPGFEPGTSRTPSVRATRLRYAPTGTLITMRRNNLGVRTATVAATSRLSPPFNKRQESAQSVAQVQQHFTAQELRRSFRSANCDFVIFRRAAVLAKVAAGACDRESFVVQQAL